MRAREIAFDEPLFTAGASGNPEWAQPVVRLTYDSFTSPSTVFNYRVATGELTALKRAEILGGYDREEYGAGARVGDRRRRHADPGLAGVEAVVRRAGRLAAARSPVRIRRV